MLKFEIGEHYISSDNKLLICSDSNSFISEFFSINENKKLLVVRSDYGTIHDLIGDNQFKNMIFVFDSSCLYKRPFYSKIVEIGGGETKTNITTSVTCYVTNKNKADPVMLRSARRKKIKKLQESEFWRLYYKE